MALHQFTIGGEDDKKKKNDEQQPGVEAGNYNQLGDELTKVGEGHDPIEDPIGG